MSKHNGFDWENSGPGKDALAAFSRVELEDEFPNTYSGQAWRAAYRIWKATKDESRKLNVPPFDDIPGVDVSDLHLTGFMWGWAKNAVRQMLTDTYGGNPAILTLGRGNEAYPSLGPAEKAMRRALGAKE